MKHARTVLLSATFAAAALAALAFTAAPAAADSSLGEDFSRYSSEPWLQPQPGSAAFAERTPAPARAAVAPRDRRAQRRGDTTAPANAAQSRDQEAEGRSGDGELPAWWTRPEGGGRR